MDGGEKMKIGIVGSREGISKEIVFKTLDNLYNKLSEPFTIITGGARGVDNYAKEWIENSNLHSSCLKIIRPINPSDKFSYLLRNVEIITMSNAIFAFWNGKSKGTKFVIDYAKARNKNIQIIKSNTNQKQQEGFGSRR